MARIAGVDLPNEKRLDIALTYIYGIGRNNVGKIIDSTKIDGAKRVKTLTEDDINKLQKFIEKNFKVEGDLRQEIAATIKRLREIGSYRGFRHAHKLPVRGQRTRSNARTKRGKRMTIGALKKDDRAKVTESTVAGAKTEGKK
ncbi:MAG: 30S ribosomal protein S13 [Candidatus Gottesmanbacteria bacterium GW2011_GWA1_34_13]|uniref:Small ribosomal subunit protein uS13 n=1 Tax=Candidatus Gottesmanbacteria bacterium GW2011_GWA1_34_13 TaxID=1618434 RepID=A0A0G0AS16_9BACT|nr:MAG: 30S ribosomal protein S13 [Candidatus Gottesmanbacteria bacterium GW2011_GWA1_34_13]